jgi:small subunit ribosomal protein S21
MRRKGRQVQVYDGNWEKALRKFKKKITDSGILEEVRNRREFVKPTIERKVAKNQAVRRWKKYLREQQLPPKLF